MSDSVSIKVNIAGKEYPLKISSSEQQDVMAVELEINKKLKTLQTDYGVKDKQDFSEGDVSSFLHFQLLKSSI